jgi:hypothetical protein
MPPVVNLNPFIFILYDQSCHSGDNLMVHSTVSNPCHIVLWSICPLYLNHWSIRWTAEAYSPKGVVSSLILSWYGGQSQPLIRDTATAMGAVVAFYPAGGTLPMPATAGGALVTFYPAWGTLPLPGAPLWPFTPQEAPCQCLPLPRVPLWPFTLHEAPCHCQGCRCGLLPRRRHPAP